MHDTINPDPGSARIGIAEQLSVIGTLLQLLDPFAPFQPILVGSIDIVAWQAFFGQAVETIETLFPVAIRPLGKQTPKSLSTAASKLFSLAHRICDGPREHLSSQAAALSEHGLLPELDGIAPDLIDSPEESDLIANALRKSRASHDQSEEERRLLRGNLDNATNRLIANLTRRNGLLWLIQRRLKGSKQSAGKFQGLARLLESALTATRPSPQASWEDSHRWFDRLAIAVELHLLPELDAVLKEIAPRNSPTKASQSRPAPPKRQSIKDAFLRSWDTFSQSYSASRHIHASQAARASWTLFTELMEVVSDAMQEAGVLDDSEKRVSRSQRIVECVTQFDKRIISRSVLAAWDRMLSAADDYTVQVILAGLHHLEASDDDGESTAGVHRNLVYAFSEATMTRWLSRGVYAGVNADREASQKFSSEARRVRRVMEHLRRNHAAFHGRQHWAPVPKKTTDATLNRLWTLNPLLAIHPQIRALMASTSPPSADTESTRETRRRPSRKNRGNRRGI